MKNSEILFILKRYCEPRSARCIVVLAAARKYGKAVVMLIGAADDQGVFRANISSIQVK